MEIEVYNNYGDIKFDYQFIVDDLKNVFEKDFNLTESVSLILVDLPEIQRLNSEFRHLDYPTDVISFEDRDEEYLGDIFICINKVYEQAESYGHSHEREFAFLLCHGLLHLLGYDHMNAEEEKIMFTKQDEILDKTNYRRK